jgi:hypothetical protein
MLAFLKLGQWSVQIEVSEKNGRSLYSSCRECEILRTSHTVASVTDEIRENKERLMLLKSKTSQVIFGSKMLLFLAFIGTLEAQQNSSRPEAQAEDRSTVITEIEDLRDRIGGGVAEGLSGFIDPEVVRKGFALELERLSARKKSLGENSKVDLPARRQKQQAKPHANPKWVTPLPYRESSRPKSNGRSFCQSIARKLDGITADLEEAGYYDEADSMRALASGYWNKARQLRVVGGGLRPHSLLKMPIEEKK